MELFLEEVKDFEALKEVLKSIQKCRQNIK